ncbi:hypothetical protein [Aquabacterium sp. J223]|uniref:hypothetical protein n=1 Tax=Aquabacterium sp. J223 TaxID=2898431 RepID=UPI0021AD81B6|nr:hypothetical protein [Aquabacterium sp. J223]UUX94286.1 hypothetical protein LRS07_13205 [Aquabacterium sp. J223]
MRTIQLPDLPSRAGMPRPAWGSSDWASESCLKDWDELERDWLDREAQATPRSAVPPLALVVMGLAAAALLWSVLRLAEAFLLPGVLGMTTAMDLLPELIAAFLLLVLTAVGYALSGPTPAEGDDRS